MKFLLPIIAIILIAGYFLVGQSLIQKKGIPDISSPSPASQELKTFQSKLMKFSIDIPIESKPVENSGRITISMGVGEIYVDRNGTNFDSLNDYLIDLNARNKPEIISEEKISINGYQTVVRTIRFSTGEIHREIIIFVEGWIYNILTNVEPLYDDLDQIAQSFRYMP